MRLAAFGALLCASVAIATTSQPVVHVAVFAGRIGSHADAIANALCPSRGEMPSVACRRFGNLDDGTVSSQVASEYDLQALSTSAESHLIVYSVSDVVSLQDVAFLASARTVGRRGVSTIVVLRSQRACASARENALAEDAMRQHLRHRLCGENASGDFDTSSLCNPSRGGCMGMEALQRDACAPGLHLVAVPCDDFGRTTAGLEATFAQVLRLVVSLEPPIAMADLFSRARRVANDLRRLFGSAAVATSLTARTKLEQERRRAAAVGEAVLLRLSRLPDDERTADRALEELEAASTTLDPTQEKSDFILYHMAIFEEAHVGSHDAAPRDLLTALAAAQLAWQFLRTGETFEACRDIMAENRHHTAYRCLSRIVHSERLSIEDQQVFHRIVFAMLRVDQMRETTDILVTTTRELDAMAVVVSWALAKTNSGELTRAQVVAQLTHMFELAAVAMTVPGSNDASGESLRVSDNLKDLMMKRVATIVPPNNPPVPPPIVVSPKQHRWLRTGLILAMAVVLPHVLPSIIAPLGIAGLPSAVLTGATTNGAIAVVSAQRCDVGTVFQGGIRGALTFGIGDVLQGQMVLKPVAHGAVAAAMDPENAVPAFVAGAVSDVAATAAEDLPHWGQTLTSSTVSAVAAHATGGDWLEGLVTGVVVAELNHALHKWSPAVTKCLEAKPSEVTKAHVPDKRAGAVTFGFGYDCGEKTSKQILRDMRRARVPEALAQEASKAAGLRGHKAVAFALDFNTRHRFEERWADSLFVQSWAHAGKAVPSSVKDEAIRGVLQDVAFQGGHAGLRGFSNALQAAENGDRERVARELLRSKNAVQTPDRVAERVRALVGAKITPREMEATINQYAADRKIEHVVKVRPTSDVFTSDPPGS